MEYLILKLGHSLYFHKYGIKREKVCTKVEDGKLKITEIF
jgi:hypothetical protein